MEFGIFQIRPPEAPPCSTDKNSKLNVHVISVMGKKISHNDFEQAVFVGESLSTKIETNKVCHTLLQSPKFFSLLLQIDADAADQMHAAVCPLCGAGVLHQANYPRKPKACPKEVLHDYQSRWSFCCNLCRKRTTPMSVRFLGRRVYVALAVALLPQRRSTLSATAIEICNTLDVPARTLSRWRQWWSQIFPTTSLWQAQCALFMPTLQNIDLPTSLITRFTGSPHEAMRHLLAFLSPLSVRT